MLEAQAGWIAQVARRVADDAGHYDVRPETWVAYDREMQGRLSSSVWSGCDSWYVDGERITTNWPGKVAEYQQRTARVDWTDLVDLDRPA